MSILYETKRILRNHRIRPRKRLGQNFIVDSEFLHKMISYADISMDDVILEIGAGFGFLTELLSPLCKRVIAVEIDPRIIRVAKRRLSKCKNVTLLQGDILRLEIPCFDKVVSAPPYSISSPLLFWLLERRFKCAVLTLQREFAERLVAEPSASGYSRLTVEVYYRADVELKDVVPRRAFWPQPKVDSVIVLIKPRKSPFQLKNEKIFSELLRVLFTQKNKKIRNSIRPFLGRFNLSRRDVEEWINSLSFMDKRVRELSPEDIGLMANEIVDRMCEKGLL